MIQEKFDEIVARRCNLIKEVLTVKAKEYAQPGDRLHNFDVAARISGLSRERCLDGFMLKHFVSYKDILNDIDMGKLPTREYLDEKVGDIINYLILFEASVIEKIEEYDN